MNRKSTVRNGLGGGILLPAVFAITGIIVLLSLGTWQVERKAWKENLIAVLDKRINAEPAALPPPADWHRLTADDSEFFRVRLRVDLPGNDETLVYTGGSALRDDVKAPGYFVFAPANVLGGGKVVINLGYVPDRTYPRLRGQGEIIGVLRFPEQPSWFVSAHDRDGAVWYVRDHLGMAALRRWGAVAPFYIEQEAPLPPTGLPHPSRLKVHLRNDHLQYALTWYSLAAVLAAVFVVWLAKRRRELADGREIRPG